MVVYNSLLPIFHSFFTSPDSTQNNSKGDWRREAFKENKLSLQQVELLEEMKELNNSTIHSFLPPQLTNYIQVVMTVLSKLKGKNEIMHLLNSLDSFFPTFVDIFSKESELVYSALFIQLNNSTPEISLKCGALLASLLEVGEKEESRFIESMFNWAYKWLSLSTSNVHLEIVCMTLSLLVEKEQIVHQLHSLPITNPLLTRLIDISKLDVKTGYSSQHTYLILLTIWLICIDDKLVEQLVVQFNLFTFLVELIKSCAKEKVQRMSLRIILRILHEYPGDFHRLPETAALLERIQLLMEKSLSTDIEMNDLLAKCNSSLIQLTARLDLSEQFLQELTTTRLKWTSIHKNQEFWSDYSVKLFERDNFKVLLIVIDILFKASDDETICICLHDLVKYFEQCELLKGNSTGTDPMEQIKQVIDEEAGRRERFISFLNHPNPEVQFYALAAVQKIIFL